MPLHTKNAPSLGVLAPFQGQAFSWFCFSLRFLFRTLESNQKHACKLTSRLRALIPQNVLLYKEENQEDDQQSA